MNFIKWYIKMWRTPEKEWNIMDAGDFMISTVFVVIFIGGAIIFIFLLIKYFFT